MTIACDICGATVANVGEAVAAGWIPEYYEPGADDATCEPVCGVCVHAHLELDNESVAFVRVTD